MLFGLMDSEALTQSQSTWGGLSVLFHLYPPPPPPPTGTTHTHAQATTPLSSNSVVPPPSACPQPPYLSPSPTHVFILFFCGELCYDKGFTPRMHAVSAHLCHALLRYGGPHKLCQHHPGLACPSQAERAERGGGGGTGGRSGGGGCLLRHTQSRPGTDGNFTHTDAQSQDAGRK